MLTQISIFLFNLLLVILLILSSLKINIFSKFIRKFAKKKTNSIFFVFFFKKIYTLQNIVQVLVNILRIQI